MWSKLKKKKSINTHKMKQVEYTEIVYTRLRLSVISLGICQWMEFPFLILIIFSLECIEKMDNLTCTFP